MGESVGDKRKIESSGKVWGKLKGEVKRSSLSYYVKISKLKVMLVVRLKEE